MIYGKWSVQASKQTYTHTHMCSEVTLVWGEPEWAPVILTTYKGCGIFQIGWIRHKVTLHQRGNKLVACSHCTSRIWLCSTALPISELVLNHYHSVWERLLSSPHNWCMVTCTGNMMHYHLGKFPDCVLFRAGFSYVLTVRLLCVCVCVPCILHQQHVLDQPVCFMLYIL